MSTKNRPPKPRVPPQTRPFESQAMNLFEPDAHRTLAVLRVLWGVLLAGQLLVGAAGFYLMNHSKAPPINDALTWKLFGLGSALLVFNIFLGSFLRNQIYKRFWRGNVVAPTGYFMANVLMYGLLEVVVIFSVIVVILSQQFWPAIVPGVVALAVYVVNFPHGRPLLDPDILPIPRTSDQPTSDQSTP